MKRTLFGPDRWLALVLAVVSLAGTPAHAAAPAIQPGLYDELMIGYQPATHILTGYFQTETGAGRFNCIFYLTGTLAGGVARIESYFPKTPEERIAGTVKAEPPRSLSISLVEEHGGCAMAWHFADKDQPSEFTLSGAHSWSQIRVVRANKAFFYNASDEASRRRGYLVLGDGVGVVAARPGWLQVDFPNADKMTSGWVKESDLFPGP